MPEIKLHSKLAEIPRQQWNNLCGTDYPFLRHEFLQALESSGSVSPESGWQPLHLGVWQRSQLVAVMPLYLKSHSWGEYVFDWSWADAWARHGLDYYPKLLTAIPFTPSSGPRFGSTLPLHETTELFSQAIMQIASRFDASGWHALFVEPGVKSAFAETGLMTRLGTQYHWFNRDYSSFEHYLSHFTSRKRKNVRKEREKVQSQGIELITLEGREITQPHLDMFYRFYQRTYRKRGMRGYLTRAFFDQLLKNMPEHLVLVLARIDGREVACALSLKSSDCLYGRYWGCLDEFDSLHFETCYYRGIEYCIEKGLKRFDPGAQGEHKIQRGFEPIETWSVHWLREKGFHPALHTFLDEEKAMMRKEMETLSKGLPFRCDPDQQP
ncbi:GNAT family N-acetyltransferase [Marinobacterium sp. D7]|uniref:GNAT family N-acetyltransferase n=1 Tax=Marinobacterium ramblicola TaxID=2849041 RepID=UPI001C2D8ADD|nr:GNAT family N-acetyltransferase [Marinobacterium ramblicola]MBV1787930.1 GNAT family N-acetyltransferase [Marinobacterium ramblicola]